MTFAKYYKRLTALEHIDIRQPSFVVFSFSSRRGLVYACTNVFMQDYALNVDVCYRLSLGWLHVRCGNTLLPANIPPRGNGSSLLSRHSMSVSSLAADTRSDTPWAGDTRSDTSLSR